MSDTEEGPWKITAKDILDGMINYSSARHTSQIEYDDLTNKSKPLVGDLLLTKDGTLGRTAIVDAENVCINQSVALLRFNEKCSVQYAKTLLDTPMYQKQMLDDAGGGTIKHIYITKVDKMFISVPCMKEQERLVLFFNNLDNLITLHQRKCDEVKSLKKYMLQKMFPQNEQKVPEIRFEGFTEAWEQRKVVEVAPLQRGFDLPSASMKPGKYPVVMSNGIGGYHFEYKVKGPGVVTGRSGTIGKLHYIEDDYWPHNTTLWVTDFNGNNQKFIYYLYQGLDLNRFGTGSGVPTLNRNDVHDAIVSVPSKNEQERISAYLTILDQLITLHQQKCEELKKIKKFMLQKMFV